MSPRGKYVLPAVLLTVACHAPVTDMDPVTENQVIAAEAARSLAAKKGVRLDAVLFAKQPTADHTGWSAGWAVCGEYAIGFDKDYIEKLVPVDIRSIAAHEVCHIYYKDNLPCKPPYDEARASACGRELMGES